MIAVLGHLMASMQALAEPHSYYTDWVAPDHMRPVLGAVIAVALARTPAHPVAHIVLDNHRNTALVDPLDGMDEIALAVQADTFHKGLVVAGAVVVGTQECYAAAVEGRIVAECFARDTAQNLIRYVVVDVDMEPAVDHMVY